MTKIGESKKNRQNNSALTSDNKEDSIVGEKFIVGRRNRIHFAYFRDRVM